MWVVLLEMALALALLIFIVWWTWPKKKGGEDGTPPGDPDAR